MTQRKHRTPHSRPAVRLAAAVAILGLGGCADTPRPRADFEALSAQTPWQVENGRETRRFELPGGVTVFQDRRGDKVETVTMDNSGHGAVMCSWMIDVWLLAWLEACRPEEAEWQGTLSTALDRINDFIVANSLMPVTKAGIEAKMAQEKLRAVRVEGEMSDARRQTACRGKGDASAIFGPLKKGGVRSFQAELEHLLAVPRPPVTNPCL